MTSVMLKDKVVLVTGGARRIGKAIALRLATEGARVAIHYGSSEEEARETAAACGNAPIFQADLTKVADMIQAAPDGPRKKNGSKQIHESTTS